MEVKKQQTRYHLHGDGQLTLMKAVEMKKEFEKLEEPYERNGKKYIMKWRIGKTTSRQLVIDIDDNDVKNFRSVMDNLHSLFPNDTFIKIKTMHGYQIIDQKEWGFAFKNLKVLNVLMEDTEIAQYREQLLNFLQNCRTEGQLKGFFNAEFEKSGLCVPIGKIDYLYNVLGVANGKYTLRISPKQIGDKWEILSD